MKRLVICFLLVFTGIASSCSERAVSEVFNFDTEAPEGMISLSAEAAEEYFFFDSGKIVSSVIFISEDAMCANEIVIIKAVDESAAEEIETYLENRIESQKRSFCDYLPVEYEKLNGVEVTVKGVYCYYSVGVDISRFFVDIT